MEEEGGPIGRHNSTRVDVPQSEVPSVSVTSSDPKTGSAETTQGSEGSVTSAESQQSEAEKPRHLSIWVHGKKSLLSSSSEFLAKGSGGVVYSDLCDECQERVAVKIIRKTAFNQKNVDNEVKISLALKHPNIIRTYRVFDYESNTYMVQELATGGDLCDYLSKNGPIEKETILKGFFRQIARGVQYLHNVANVSHNDIKPDNVVEFNGTEQGVPRVCLIDFGHSQFTDIKARRPGIFGTTEYMPPEVFNNPSRFYVHDGVLADIWALGMTLFAMMTGTLPWAEPSIHCKEFKYFLLRFKNHERGAMFIHNPVQMLGFTSHLVELLDGMVNPDVHKRFTIDKVMEYLDYPWVNEPKRRRSSALMPEQGKPLVHTKPMELRHPSCAGALGICSCKIENKSDDEKIVEQVTNALRELRCVHGAAAESIATGIPVSGRVSPEPDEPSAVPRDNDEPAAEVLYVNRSVFEVAAGNGKRQPSIREEIDPLP